jgi:hypothetical protein
LLPVRVWFGSEWLQFESERLVAHDCEKAGLLGIFSVNLRRALDLAPKSETEAGAKVLPEARSISYWQGQKPGCEE